MSPPVSRDGTRAAGLEEGGTHTEQHGTVDKAIRFPLDADIEEISPGAAHDVFDMVARRTYVPLQRR